MATKILVVDNYDSFVYNLVQYLAQLGAQCTVVRNDEISLDEINFYDMIMLSPGPGIPEEAGILKEIISTYAGKKPIFGVCLGLQALSNSLKTLQDIKHHCAIQIPGG